MTKTKGEMKIINIQVDNIVGWPDQGMVYIDNGSIPTGVYSFKKVKSKGKIPTPIFIKEYKNRIKLSQKTIDDIEKNL